MIGAPSTIAQLLGGMLRPVRAIGALYPDVVTEEIHVDSLQITEHPVERSAPIADHAYKQPSTLILRCGWANSSRYAQTLLGIIPNNPIGEFTSTDTYSRSVYHTLLRMQHDRELIEVFTGKINYKNMLISSITVTTDRHSEYALLAIIAFREVIIVDTQPVALPAYDKHADRATTAPQQNQGIRQPKPLADRSTPASGSGQTPSDLPPALEGFETGGGF